MLWGLRAVSREIDHWRVHAQAIPDETIRADALQVLANKRTHLHGAALFWTLPRRRNLHLLRLLVAYELIWDFLDNLSERAAAHGRFDGRDLHRAIADAIDPCAPASDYYQQHPWHQDGGYLRSLVETCQTACRLLPAYPQVRPLVMREANRAQVLSLNHYPNPTNRDDALKGWVAAEYPDEQHLNWWELSGAASAPLAIHALLALAAEPECSKTDIDRTYSAYFPWMSAATTMLDSYVDQLEDVRNGDHSYVAHYQNQGHAIKAIEILVQQSITEARSLHNGPRHTVIAAAMIAMYLSKNSARAPELCTGTRSFISAGGTLSKLLLPILRTWRVAYAQSSA